ncbi:hypothetical protein CYMTET_55886 [Cymbomonas tetramitiformis]|uniref:Uncharacterized protein n=1 Tax=Cymbomonas tetramitiformis TaxID=36881 RepID=A0AAE0EN54_9CHLO|nr:hypothetical protein CYMTET_55886 [Cymbomonas tetramitiformis]
MKSTHAPAVVQHEKVKHPTSLVQQLRDQSSFFGLKHVEDDSGDEALDSDSEHALEDTAVGVEPQAC